MVYEQRTVPGLGAIHFCPVVFFQLFLHELCHGALRIPDELSLMGPGQRVTESRQPVPGSGKGLDRVADGAVGTDRRGAVLVGTLGLLCAGLLSATTDILPDLWVLCILIPIAAIAGDQTGYWIGRKFGPPLFNRPDSRFFKREYVDQTSAFFEKHGPRAIILARFVPIVRAFVPVMAGTSKMHYRTFLVYDIIGGILWGAGVTTLGYFLGQIDFVEKYIERSNLLDDMEEV